MLGIERRRKRTARASLSYWSGWEAALREVDHQAQHWATPEHGAVGVLIAEALRSTVQIARGGGLACEHPDHQQPTRA